MGGLAAAGGPPCCEVLRKVPAKASWTVSGVRNPEAGSPLAAKIGSETKLAGSLAPPPLPRIWKRDVDGSVGAREEAAWEEEAGASVIRTEALWGPGGGEVSRSNFERSNFLFLGSILPSGHLYRRRLVWPPQNWQSLISALEGESQALEGESQALEGESQAMEGGCHRR